MRAPRPENAGVLRVAGPPIERHGAVVEQCLVDFSGAMAIDIARAIVLFIEWLEHARAELGLPQPAALAGLDRCECMRGRDRLHVLVDAIPLIAELARDDDRREVP